MHSVPGNPFDQEDKPLPPEVIARLEAHYHLDEPVWRQYLRYMGGALRGDLGPSYLYEGPQRERYHRAPLPGVVRARQRWRSAWRW